MAQPQHPPPASESWSVNLPAVIGVVFVFLVGVVIWVIVASGDGDDDTVASSSTSTTVTTEPIETTTTEPGATSSTAPGTTTPAPMPDPTDVTSTSSSPTSAPPATTAPPTMAPPTTAPPAPPTTAEGADPDAVPGDLGIPGFPMQAPPCNDSFITVIASAVGADVAAEGVLAYLEDYPTSNYLRTDQTCPSLTQAIDGEPIYVVFFGPFPFASDACQARAEGTEGSYVRTLSETEPPDYTVDCEA